MTRPASASAPAIRIVEVGPRDGLQNEARIVPLTEKLALVQGLIDAGLGTVETGSFVAPDRVPQMADSDRVLAHFAGRTRIDMPVLVPNLRGLDRARAAGARSIALFAATTEAFARANLNASRAESFARFAAVAAAALAAGLRVRGYVSCAVHCPFDGWVDPGIAAELGAALAGIGCHEVSFCDTTGAGTPDRARALVRAASGALPLNRIAVHFHDTCGQALANTLASLDLGVGVVDASVAGLGGCPFSPGAAGNLPTEDLVYMLEGLGLRTGVDLDRLAGVGERISAALGRRGESRAARAIAARRMPALEDSR